MAKVKKWTTVKACEVFVPVTDKSHNGNLQVLSATQDRGIVPRTEIDIDIKFDEKSLPTYKKVVPGNFVIHLRSFQGGLAYSRVEGIISPAYTVLEPKQPICDEFYEQFFKSSRYIKQLEVTIYGIRDGKQISYDDFGRIPIPFPPLPEQRRIAEILTTADRVIALQERLIVAKQKQKRWLMQNLLTGKIRLSGFNEDWESKRLGDVAEGFQYGLNASSKEYDGINKYLRITDIDEENRNIIYSNLTSPNCELAKEYLLHENDLLFARTGASVGKTYLYNSEDGIVYFAGYLIRCNITKANPKYIFYITLLSTYKEWVRVMSQRSGQPGINAEEYQAFAFLLPPRPEQTAIAEILSTADREIELLNRELQQQKQIKKYLMQQLLTGRIRVKTNI
jgi:type I restriction enzyme S subunit